MNTVCHSIVEIDPFVRLALDVTLSKTDNEMRVCYDHRLFCIRSGECLIDLGGARIRPLPGDCILICSGTPYRFHPGEEGISLSVINFDFFGGTGRTAQASGIPIPPYSDYRAEKVLEKISFSEEILREGYAYVPMHGEPPRELSSLVLEAERGELFCLGQMNAYLKICLGRIFRRLLIPSSDSGISRHREILAYLAEHYAEPLDNKTVAARFHYHPNYIGELIRSATGMPLHRYLLRLRIRRASELLVSTSLPIAEIARLTGFPNAAYFTSYFRRTVGVTPGAFRG